MPRPHSRRGVRSAFTMIELLVVIGMIILLAAILVPVAARVRLQAHVVSTTGQMQRIMNAIQDYYHDFSAYPGPLSEAELVSSTGTGQSNTPIVDNTNPQPASGTVSGKGITSSENLVLGLLGFLGPNNPLSGQSGVTQNLFYYTPPQHDVLSLNPNRPASYHYLDYLPSELSPGKVSLMDFDLGSATATDSAVPEFIDQIPSPMPILYMRASVGAQYIVAQSYGNLLPNPTPPYQYDPSELFMYVHNVRFNNGSGQLQTLQQMSSSVFQAAGGGSGGTTTSSFAADVATPYQSWADYLTNPNVANQALGKDAFILIDAGPDRMYGTHDDIIVAP